MEKFGLNASDSSPQPAVPSQVPQRPQQQLSQRKVEREKESDKKNAEIQDTKQSQAQKQQLQKKQQGEHYEKQQQNILARKPSPEGDKKPTPAPSPSIVKKSPETEEERFHAALSRIFSVAFTREDASVQMVPILKYTILPSNLCIRKNQVMLDASIFFPTYRKNCRTKVNRFFSPNSVWIASSWKLPRRLRNKICFPTSLKLSLGQETNYERYIYYFFYILDYFVDMEHGKHTRAHSLKSWGRRLCGASSHMPPSSCKIRVSGMSQHLLQSTPHPPLCNTLSQLFLYFLGNKNSDHAALQLIPYLEAPPGSDNELPNGFLERLASQFQDEGLDMVHYCSLTLPSSDLSNIDPPPLIADVLSYTRRVEA